MNQNPPHVTLSSALVQAIGQYLATKPFNEVAQLIGQLQAEATASVQAQAEAPTQPAQ